MKLAKTLFLFVATLLFASCEKYVAEEGTQYESKVVNGNLVVKAECVVTKAAGDEDEQVSLPLNERFTRMSMVLYQNDVRVDYVNQTNTDKDFGTMSVDLEPGTYQLVVLAHSGTRSPTTTNCHKISFSAPLTDVFSYYGEVVVGKEASKITVQLTRAVAKIQLNITDDIPADVKQSRLDEIMELQEQISLEVNEAKVGSTMRVIIDSEDEEYYIGRTEFDSPEVDPEVLIAKNQPLKIGEFYDVTITEALPYELIAEVK